MADKDQLIYDNSHEQSYTPFCYLISGITMFSSSMKAGVNSWSHLITLEFFLDAKP